MYSRDVQHRLDDAKYMEQLQSWLFATSFAAPASPRV